MGASSALSANPHPYTAMTSRKRVYLPPTVEAMITALRQEPGYADESDAALLTVIADRASRPASAATPAMSAPVEQTPADDFGDIDLGF